MFFKFIIDVMSFAPRCVFLLFSLPENCNHLMDQKKYIETNRIIGANEKTEISLKQLQIWRFLAALYLLRFQKSPNLPLSLAA